MSYLVKFSGSQGETWVETFETESQVLQCKNKDSIISIQKVEEELTLEQLQKQIDNKAPTELQEADFKDKHIKVGDITLFRYEYMEDYEGYPEVCYETYYGRIKSIIQKYKTIRPTIVPIAYEDGTLLKEDDYNYQTCPREVYYDQIDRIYDVCTVRYFDMLIKKAEDLKKEHWGKILKEHNLFCQQQDRDIDKLKVLKEITEQVAKINEYM